MKTRVSFTMAALAIAGAGGLWAKADDGGGGGGSPAEPKTLPEALKALKAAEEKIQAAELEVGAAEKKATDAEAEAEKAKASAKEALEAGAAVRAELAQANEKLGAVTKERDAALEAGKKSAERVEHLEKLCQVRGVDPSKAVAAVPEGETPAAKEATLRAKLSETTDPEEKYRIAQQLKALRSK